MGFLVAHFLMLLISQFASVKNTAKFEFQIRNLLTDTSMHLLSLSTFQDL